MRKRILLCICIISTLSYGKVNDYRGILTEQQRNELDNLTTEFENKTGIKLNINMAPDGFSSELGKNEISLNLIEKLNEAEISLSAQLQISNDINSVEKQRKIREILLESSKIATVGNEYELSKDFINNLEPIFEPEKNKENTGKIETNKLVDSKNNTKMSLSTKIILGILLTFFLLSIRILQVKRLKRLHREKQRRKKMQQIKRKNMSRKK